MLIFVSLVCVKSHLSVLKSLLCLCNNDYGWRAGFVKSDSLWEETVLESSCLGLSAASLLLDSRSVKVFFLKSHPKIEFVLNWSSFLLCVSGLFALLLMVLDWTRPGLSSPLRPICDLRVLDHFIKEAWDAEAAVVRDMHMMAEAVIL